MEQNRTLDSPPLLPPRARAAPVLPRERNKSTQNPLVIGETFCPSCSVGPSVDFAPPPPSRRRLQRHSTSNLFHKPSYRFLSLRLIDTDRIWILTVAVAVVFAGVRAHSGASQHRHELHITQRRKLPNELLPSTAILHFPWVPFLPYLFFSIFKVS